MSAMNRLIAIIPALLLGGCFWATTKSEGKAMRKDGSLLDCEVHGVPMSYGGKPHVLYIGRDITARKTAEEALRILVRDDPNPKVGDTFTERRGVRIYRNVAADKIREKKWERHILEDGGVAVEDLAVGDLNGDGKPDIVAVGRATGNARIYWNQGK